MSEILSEAEVESWRAWMARNGCIEHPTLIVSHEALRAERDAWESAAADAALQVQRVVLERRALRARVATLEAALTETMHALGWTLGTLNDPDEEPDLDSRIMAGDAFIAARAALGEPTDD